MNFKKIFNLVLLMVIIFSCAKKKENIKEKVLEKINKIKKTTTELKKEFNKKTNNIYTRNEDNLKNLKKNLTKKFKNKKKEIDKSELWKKYKEIKNKINEAKAKNQFENLIKLLKKEADISRKLGRKDIEAWQLNNIGYYSIEEFKKRVNYDKMIAKINSEKDRKRRAKLYQELQKQMRKHLALLTSSYKDLILAKKLSKEVGDKKQQKIIKNNITFIDDIKKMLKRVKESEK